MVPGWHSGGSRHGCMAGDRARLCIEALILAGRFAAGSHPAATQVLIELVQGVTWAFFVCAGLSLGTAIAKVGRHMKIISAEAR